MFCRRRFEDRRRSSKPLSLKKKNPATIFTSPYHVGEFVLSNLKLLHSFDYLIVSLAQNGTAIIRKADDGSYSFIGLPPPIRPDLVVSASGAGDRCDFFHLLGDFFDSI